MKEINEKIINTQKAMLYVVYMIVGSYFDKTIIATKVLEKKLLLYYKEQNVNKQYKLEDICISYVEKRLKKEIDPDMWRHVATVAIDQELMTVSFTTPKGTLNIKVEDTGSVNCKS